MTLKRNGFSHIKVYAIRITRNSDGKVSWFKLNDHVLYSKNPESAQLRQVLNTVKNEPRAKSHTLEIAPKWIWYNEVCHPNELF